MFIGEVENAYDATKEVDEMELYVIANLHNYTVLGKKGVWISTKNSKSALRDVCWFDSLSIAKAACVPYNPNTVTVLTSKNLCKKIGIKKIPGYIQENYRGSVLSRTMKVQISEEEREKGGYKSFDIEGEKKECKERSKQWLELRGHDPSVMQAAEIENIRKELLAVYETVEVWKRRQAEVLKTLKYIEAKEQDLLHIIEFCRLEENRAELLICELHNVRCRRRQLKNEFTALTAAIKVTVGISSTTVQTAIGNMDKLGNRRYCCRTITGDTIEGWLEEMTGQSKKV